MKKIKCEKKGVYRARMILLRKFDFNSTIVELVYTNQPIQRSLWTVICKRLTTYSVYGSVYTN